MPACRLGGLLLVAVFSACSLAACQAAGLTSATAQTAVSGRVLASARGQVAWLDLAAPRPRR